LDLPRSGDARPRGCHELADYVDVAGCLRVRNRTADETALAIPTPRAAMELRNDVRIASRQLGAQILTEQMVVAVSQSLRVEGAPEGVAALPLQQHPSGVCPAGQCITQ